MKYDFLALTGLYFFLTDMYLMSFFYIIRHTLCQIVFLLIFDDIFIDKIKNINFIKTLKVFFSNVENIIL